MNTHAPEPQCFEFSFPRLDTVLEVETSSAGVVIRASRDTFSAERKACFIRELTAEGFIGEEYRWRRPDGQGAVRWIVDAATFMPGATCIAQTRRLMLRLFLSATALWLILMGNLFFGLRR